jgi:hypothetical protein
MSAIVNAFVWFYRASQLYPEYCDQRKKQVLVLHRHDDEDDDVVLCCCFRCCSIVVIINLNLIPCQLTLAEKAWNQQTYVVNCHRLRSVLAYASGFSCLLGFAVTLLAPGWVQPSALGATLVLFSTLAECAVVPAFWVRDFPSWPLAPFPPLEWLSTFLDRHVRIHQSLMVLFFGALLWSLVCSCSALIHGQEFLGTVSLRATFYLFALLLCVDGHRMFVLGQPWLSYLGTFAFSNSFADTSRCLCICLGGTYFYSGLSKVLAKTYYADIAPDFFAPSFRLLRYLLPWSRVHVLIQHLIAGMGVTAEAVLGLAMWECARDREHFPPWLAAMSAFMTMFLHLYIIAFLRDLALFNWNAISMMCCGLVTMTAGPPPSHWAIYHVFLVVVYMFVPILGWIGTACSRDDNQMIMIFYLPCVDSNM